MLTEEFFDVEWKTKYNELFRVITEKMANPKTKQMGLSNASNFTWLIRQHLEESSDNELVSNKITYEILTETSFFAFASRAIQVTSEIKNEFSVQNFNE